MRAASRLSRSATVVVACAVLVASRGDGSSRYARYQDKDAAVSKIDALLATVPQDPGAQLRQRQTFSGSYHVAPDDFIEAEPYSGDFSYSISEPVEAAAMQRFFRRVLPGAGWRCQFGRRTVGSQLVFGQKRPPIRTIPGD